MSKVPPTKGKKKKAARASTVSPYASPKKRLVTYRRSSEDSSSSEDNEEEDIDAAPLRMADVEQKVLADLETLASFSGASRDLCKLRDTVYEGARRQALDTLTDILSTDEFAALFARSVAEGTSPAEAARSNISPSLSCLYIKNGPVLKAIDTVTADNSGKRQRQRQRQRQQRCLVGFNGAFCIGKASYVAVLSSRDDPVYLCKPCLHKYSRLDRRHQEQIRKKVVFPAVRAIEARWGPISKWPGNVL